MVIIFLCNFNRGAVPFKISDLFVSVVLICFCSILEKDNFIENVYIVLSY